MTTQEFISECETIFSDFKEQPIMIFGKISYQIGFYKGFCKGSGVEIDWKTVEEIKTKAFAKTFE